MESQAGYQILKPFGTSPNLRIGQLDINLRLEQQDEEYLLLEIKGRWIQTLFLMINGSISRKIIGLNHTPMISTFDAQVKVALRIDIIRSPCNPEIQCSSVIADILCIFTATK